MDKGATVARKGKDRLKACSAVGRYDPEATYAWCILFEWQRRAEWINLPEHMHHAYIFWRL